MYFRAEEAKTEMKEFITFSRQVEAELDKELSTTKSSLSKRDKEVTTLTEERDRLKVHLHSLVWTSFFFHFWIKKIMLRCLSLSTTLSSRS